MRYQCFRILTLCVLTLAAAGCAPSRSLLYIEDAYQASIINDASLARIATVSGFTLTKKVLPDSGMTNAFYADLDALAQNKSSRGTTSFVLVSPLLYRETVSAQSKYPALTFAIAGEVPGLPSRPGLAVPTVSRTTASMAAGEFCGKVVARRLSQGKKRTRLFLLVPGDDGSQPRLSGTDGTDEAAFSAGFVKAASADLMVKVPVMRADIEDAYARSLPTLDAVVNDSGIACVLLGRASPLWGMVCTGRGVPVVCEGGDNLPDPSLILGVIAVDQAALYRSAMGGLQNRPMAPVNAAFRVTNAGHRALDGRALSSRGQP